MSGHGPSLLERDLTSPHLTQGLRRRRHRRRRRPRMRCHRIDAFSAVIAVVLLLVLVLVARRRSRLSRIPHHFSQRLFYHRSRRCAPQEAVSLTQLLLLLRHNICAIFAATRMRKRK